MKEDLYDIGMAIQRHIDKEKFSHTRIPAIGRAYCSLNSTYRGREAAQQFWIVIGDTTKTLKTDGIIVHRDSRMGEVLAKYYSGVRRYTQITINPRRKNDVDVTIHNRAVYRYLYVGASRATTHLAATFTEEEGNEDVIKYFDRTTDNWKL